jgi:hypothetical protein
MATKKLDYSERITLVRQALAGAPLNELKEITDEVIRELKLARDFHARSKVREFRIGDFAQFQSRKHHGTVVKIQVEKITGKNLVGPETHRDGMEVSKLKQGELDLRARWRVTASLCTKVA